MISLVIDKLKRDGFVSLLVSIAKYPFNYRYRWRFLYRKMLSNDKISDRFREIYEHNLWSSAESLSGEGSEVSYTEPLRGWLVENLPKLKVRHFVDAPCGDFNWMKLVTPKLDMTYIGLDIVPSVIEKNNHLYSQNLINFKVANICEDKLPSCDLIMVRDCLFHLSYEDIDKFLENLHSTDYKYLLTTTHSDVSTFDNTNITSGDFRRIDIFSTPFNFNEDLVIKHILDSPEGCIPKEMILMEKKSVPTNLSFN